MVSSSKKLSLTSMFAVAVGLVVVQGTMVSLLQGAGIGGTGFILALSFAALLALFYVFTFSELSLMMPKGRSLSCYTQVAIGHFPAIVAVLAGYITPAIFGLSAELILVDEIFSTYILPQSLSGINVGLLLLAFLVIVNLLAIDVFAKIQNIFAFSMLALIVLVAVLGIVSPPIAGSEASGKMLIDNPLGVGALSLTALAIWSFLGLEFVCPLSPEAEDPTRTVRTSMILALVVLLLIYILYITAGITRLPMEQLASSPLPHLDLINNVFGQWGVAVLALVAITATASTVNTVLAVVPRMLLGMAQDRQLPKAFAKVNRYNVPWLGVLVMGGITCIPAIGFADQADAIVILLISAATAWILAYIIAHVDLLVLRFKYPQVYRPYRSPFYPVPQIAGIIGFTYVFFNCAPTPDLIKTVYGNSLVVLGISAGYALLWILLVMKKGLFRAEPISIFLADSAN